MPLDPSIPLQAFSGGQPFNNPFGSLRDILAMQDAMDKRRQQQEQRAAQQDIQRILQRHGDDLDGAISELKPKYPSVALELEQNVLANRKSKFDALESQLKTDSARLTLGSQLLQSANDDVSYQLAKHAILTMNQDTPELGELLPENYDPERIQQLLKLGLTAKDYTTTQQDALKLALSGDWERAIGTWLSTAQTPEQYAQGLQGAKVLGAPAGILSQFDPQFSPEAVQRAAQIGLRPKERAELAGQEAQRAEAVRHNIATEGLTARGQDLSAATQRRGQDLSAATARRGQDLTDARERTTGGSTGKLSATAIEKIAGVDQALGMIGDIEGALPKFQENIGIVAGRVTGAKLATGVGISQDLAEFDSQLTGLKNSVIKAITGAQMSEPEAKRIMGQLPDLTNPPEVFKARLATTKRNLDTLKRRTIELSGGSVAPAATSSGTLQREIPGFPGAMAESTDGGKTWKRIK